MAGAEEALINKDPESGGVKDIEGLKAAYWRDTPEERREALMPFFWSVMAKQGQVYGNRHKGSSARVTNGMHFSYPGYNETLCGFADPRIDSNDKKLNHNVTVFEWLARKPGYGGRRRRVRRVGLFSVHLQLPALRIPGQCRPRPAHVRRDHAADRIAQ